jgi:hypothetical protein
MALAGFHAAAQGLAARILVSSWFFPGMAVISLSSRLSDLESMRTTSAFGTPRVKAGVPRLLSEVGHSLNCLLTMVLVLRYAEAKVLRNGQQA